MTLKLKIQCISDGSDKMKMKIRNIMKIWALRRAVSEISPGGIFHISAIMTPGLLTFLENMFPN